VAALLNPLALVAGVVLVASCAVGVAQTQGCTCAPEKIGPPIG
jgi:hypothetical protein